jgi:hypothetical protein
MRLVDTSSRSDDRTDGHARLANREAIADLRLGIAAELPSDDGRRALRLEANEILRLSLAARRRLSWPGNTDGAKAYVGELERAPFEDSAGRKDKVAAFWEPSMRWLRMSE